MEWIKLDHDNCPHKEVLAINDRKDYLIGYVAEAYLSPSTFPKFICENDNELLQNVTHFMPLPEPPKE